MADAHDPKPDDLMTTGEVARILMLSPDMVRWLEREGPLAAQRTTSGVRLFRRREVDDHVVERAGRSKEPRASRSTSKRLSPGDEEDA